MNAIYSHKTQKQLLLSLVVLLFLFSNLNSLFSQDTRTHIPKGLNSWKPSFLLPKVTDSPGPDSVNRTDFTIQMNDGVLIDCLKYIPVGTAPAGGWLTVIMVHGYGDNKNTLAGFCHDQATYGYYTMTFSVRGQGNSGGLSNLISNIEAQDLLQIIQWVKNDSVNGSNPGKILIMGGSQGGLLPMKAACMGGQPVSTIISSVAPPNFASSWIENGSIKMTCLWTMDYPSDTARYTDQVNTMKSWIYDDTKASWDSLSRVLPQGRDFVTSLPNLQIPVMLEGTWQDKFFNSQGWIDNITTLNVPYTSYYGAVRGHGGEISLTEDQWHMDWFNNWFYQWLWNIPTPILNQAKYQYAYTMFPVLGGSNWTFVHDSLTTPMKNINTSLRLYFNNNRTLKTTANHDNNQTQQLKNQVANGYTLQQVVFDEFKGTNFQQRFKVDTVSFITTPLTAPLKWVGVPNVSLDYSSNATTFCQFNYEIYEVLPTGQQRFISRVNYTDRNYTKNSRRTASFKGQGHAHLFLAGSKIKIKLTNLDRVQEDSAFFDGTNPFVLPSMKNGTHNMYLSSNSYIDLPVINSTASPQGFFRDEENAGTVNNEAVQFKLSQNYPNPFNPSTTIEYSVQNAGKVELKVYDILGREVQTLVNDVQNPGSYSVLFNASNLSSGVYFYKLVSGGYTDIKKMILVK